MIGLVGFVAAQYRVASADDQNGNGLGAQISSQASGEGESASPVAVVGSSEGENGGNGSTEFSISNSGQVSLHGGKLTAVSGGNVTVSVFGLSVNAAIGASTVMTGMGTSTLSSSNVGDTVDLTGTIASTTGIIAAQTFRDETYANQSIQSIQQQIQQLMALLKQLEAQGSSKGGN